MLLKMEQNMNRQMSELKEEVVKMRNEKRKL